MRWLNKLWRRIRTWWRKLWLKQPSPITDFLLEIDMADLQGTWTLPTTRQSGRPLPPEEIDQTLIETSIDYGDLDDVVTLLTNDPLTRQAFLPMWFPEDTGVVHGTRVPCSLGYHFMQRDGRLSITYYIRSCDIVRPPIVTGKQHG